MRRTSATVMATWHALAGGGRRRPSGPDLACEIEVRGEAPNRRAVAVVRRPHGGYQTEIDVTDAFA